MSLNHSKECKMVLMLLEGVGIFWGNAAFAHSAIMLHANTCYELLPEQHLGLDGCLVYSIRHSRILRSSEATLTTL